MIKINNWSSHQSYKDRKPPWIRFHKSMLDNYEFHMMSVNARALLPMLWLLASEDDDPTSGLIKDNTKKIAFRLRCSEKEVTQAIKECVENGFVQVIEVQPCIESVTKPYVNSVVSVTPETETETETYSKEAEKEKEVGDFDNFWNAYGKIGNKQQAIKSYNKSIKGGTTHETIIRGLRNYQTYCRANNTEQRYIKHASTWLNNRGWDDDYTIRTTIKPTSQLSKHERAKIALGLA